MEYVNKIVDFHKYCKDCEYYKNKEYEDPCHDCLNNPTNVNSQKPVNFKKKEK